MDWPRHMGILLHNGTYQSSIMKRHAKRPVVPSYGVATDSNDWVYLKIDQELIESSIETLLNLSPEVVTRLWDHQKRLNNSEVQVDYTNEELAIITITNLDYPRIPRIVQSCSSRFWQRTVI
ncbi:hypothetical protein BO85DRAFT_436591 [Aspergillus piperis CBS 112811]|uniref:Uncharacterized protein n=1 Tax=Aspergillus piperis CBS 112811 TaxID=1448313 RepID=A0A8G1R6Y6_9EURO|nr:hypothetical protein BO85DRAFT_436591 [Aspergillus piperis CBS 112811]RAH59637.1 hypothetical protein BO85DRAFT_436591 [Aspergillus piperis CBS 112811]